MLGRDPNGVLLVLAGGFLIVTAAGVALRSLVKFLNSKLNKYGITVGKKEDNGQS